MQQLQIANNVRLSPDVCAQNLLAAIPTVMRFIRQQMRQHRQAELTVPQFRVLVVLSHDEAISLSDLAENLGLSPAAMSRMVDLLVRRGLISRQTRTVDRRGISLSLTRRGRETFRAAQQATRAVLAQNLSTLSPRELARVNSALQTLNRVFAPGNNDLKPVRKQRFEPDGVLR